MEFLAFEQIRKCKSKLESPVPVSDLLEGNAIQLTLIPSESDHEDEYPSDEESLACKLYREENPVSAEFDLQDASQIASSASDWLEIPGEFGIKKRIIRDGKDADRKVPPGSKLYFTYIGHVEGSTEPFDAVHVKIPKSVILGNGDCILGLQLGLETMCVGEVSQFFIPHKMAYGEVGCPDRIPGGSNVIFTVLLQQFIPKEKLQDAIFKNAENMQEMDFQEILLSAETLNSEGLSFYRQNDYKAADQKFRLGIRLLETRNTATSEEHLQRERLLGSLILNRCTGLVESKDIKYALSCGKKYMKLDFCPKKYLAFYLIAQIHLAMENHKEASEYCRKSRMELKYPDKKHIKLCSNLEKEIKTLAQTYAKKEKEMCKKMFRFGF